jgi:LPXTG-motif cell wall-anchored protein
MALGLAALALAGPARADVGFRDNHACAGLHEGDVCDQPRVSGRHSAYRGKCAVSDLNEGLNGLSCFPDGPRLSPAQQECEGYGEGDACFRPSGADGRCARVGSRTVTALGGGSTVEMVLYECRYTPPDRTGEKLVTIAVLGGATAASILLIGVLVFRRRRAAAKRAAEKEQESQRNPP